MSRGKMDPGIIRLLTLLGLGMWRCRYGYWLALALALAGAIMYLARKCPEK